MEETELVPDTTELRNFALGEIGPEALTLEHGALMARLFARARSQNWRRNRDNHQTVCHQCGWEAYHSTKGPLWHVTKIGKFFEHPTRAARRPNFRWSSRRGEWVCVNCLRRDLSHHPESAKAPRLSET